MEVMKDLIAGLPRFSSECFDYLFVFVPCFYVVYLANLFFLCMQGKDAAMSMPLR